MRLSGDGEEVCYSFVKWSKGHSEKRTTGCLSGRLLLVNNPPFFRPLQSVHASRVTSNLNLKATALTTSRSPIDLGAKRR